MEDVCQEASVRAPGSVTKGGRRREEKGWPTRRPQPGGHLALLHDSPVTCHDGAPGHGEVLCLPSPTPGTPAGATPSSSPGLPVGQPLLLATRVYPQYLWFRGAGRLRVSSILTTTGCGRHWHSPSSHPKAALPLLCPPTPRPGLAWASAPASVTTACRDHAGSASSWLGSLEGSGSTGRTGGAGSRRGGETRPCSWLGKLRYCRAGLAQGHSRVLSALTAQAAWEGPLPVALSASSGDVGNGVARCAS